MKYKIILFDADDTLFDFQRSEKISFENTIKEFCDDYDENYHFAAYKEINNAIWGELEAGLITQAKLKTERFKRLNNKLNINIDENLLSDTYIKNLGNCSYLLEGAKELVEDLSKKYILGLITNGVTMIQENRIKNSTIPTFFKNITISEKIGISKPNPGIFEHALKDLEKVEKNEILMIGDSLTSDIQGGINFGIDTCWFNPKRLENKTDVKPTYEVSSFDEIRSLLLA